MNEGITPALELAVPKPKRAVIGALIGTSFLLFFILLAIYNLCSGRAIIASSCWLLLVGTVLFGFCKERGIGQVVVGYLGAFSSKESIQAIPRESGKSEIQFGYRLFGARFQYLRIAADKIAMVHWHTGQLSSRLGRDAGDWSVAVWYEHDDPAKLEKQKWMRHPDLEVYIVGIEGQKEGTGVFGRALVDFLRKSGSPLVQGDNDCTFVRPVA